MKQPRLKLAPKIILMFIAILIGFYIIVLIGGAIYRMSGIKLPKNHDEIESWLILIIIIVPPAIGSSLIALFSFALNKTIVARIRRLKDATALVATGNLEGTLEVRGGDELSELTESFNKMTAELRANEYLSKDFVRNISHEYKTPLSVVKAYGELIESESNKDLLDKSVLQGYAQIIMDEADRLSGLSRNLLQLSLLDSTTIIRKEDVFSPAEQIRQILRHLQMRWSEKNIEFCLDLEAGIIKSNEQLLYQVWQNLISNAIKFTATESKIKIALSVTPKNLYFAITDSGTGIADADKDKVFTQFYMADKSRNSDGSGLGLAIVKKIIEKMDGNVSFESEIEKGSVFKVDLNL